MSRFEIARSEVGRTEGDDRHDDHDGGHRQRDRHAATVLWAEIIDRSDDKNENHRRQRHVGRRDTEITRRRPSTQRRRDNKIRDQQERADRCEEAALASGRGINAAAIWKMGADNNVVVADDRGEGANCENDRERSETGGNKSKADNVGFARAPISVEESSRAFPIHISWAMDRAGVRDKQISHSRWSDCSPWAAPDKRFVESTKRPVTRGNDLFPLGSLLLRGGSGNVVF